MIATDTEDAEAKPEVFKGNMEALPLAKADTYVRPTIDRSNVLQIRPRAKVEKKDAADKDAPASKE
jgi:hypothetical protein